MDASDWMILLKGKKIPLADAIFYFLQNMAAITQHVIVEQKERVKVRFFLFFPPYSYFGLSLRHMLIPHMCCKMQNKLSKSRVS